eukprot:TRINITY_DN89911_c0_g1_i1.p1 TRINITY_DN89911_c0_g1~~TRINITY_DN89911_c0_g1_i1.p1  ORF type:complete len:436 (-),score=89.11 TRINITY_DN89911_c0_g1_i1:454-1761(-)
MASYTESTGDADAACSVADDVPSNSEKGPSDSAMKLPTESVGGAHVAFVSTENSHSAADKDTMSDDEEESPADDSAAPQVAEDTDKPMTKKDRKRAQAEQKRAEWKEKQREKRKRQRTAGNGSGRGGGWRARQFDAPTKTSEAEGTIQESTSASGGAADQEASASGLVSTSCPPADAAEQEVKRSSRAEKKAAELADFKSRCAAGTTVVIDAEWEDSMSEKELKSLVQQLMFCYGSNRGASHPVRLIFSGVAADSFTSQKLRKMSGFDSWPIEIFEGPYINNLPKEKLVYLTADAENVLESFDKDKIYIIGGIVDHNRLKGVTMAKAQEQKIATAQLPISRHIDMGAYSRVLTVNHVLQIVLEHQATGDWRHVFEKCIPGRKTFIDTGNKSGGDSGQAPGAKKDNQHDETLDAKAAVSSNACAPSAVVHMKETKD